MSTHEYGVSLMQQYKKCQRVNQDLLRNAKNIEDLVNIKIQTIDKQLVNKDNTYNFQYDPLQFQQQVPLMGDRTFLINQAILQKSSQKQRYAPSLKEAREIYSGQTTKRDYLQNFAHAGMDLEEFTASIEKSSLANNEREVKTSNQAYRKEQEKERINQEKSKVEQELTDSISKDPVQILKSIFKKKEFKKRPLEANQIADKYRKLQIKEKQKEEKRRQINMLNQKQFKEDEDSKINTITNEQFTRDMILQRNLIDHQMNFDAGLGMQDIQNDELLESKFIREPTPNYNQHRETINYSENIQNYHNEMDYHQNQNPQVQKPSPQNFNNYQQDFNNYQVASPQKDDGLSLKQRLENLRRMFDEEENSIVLNQELERGVVDYELKMPKELNSRRPKKERVQSEDTSVNDSEDNLEKEDLKKFLTNKIQEIKKRMNHQHPNFEVDQRKAQKFKASTLCKIQAVKNYGNEKLEEHFKNRMNKTGVDIAFKNAMVKHEKKQLKLQELEHEKQIEMLAEHRRQTMTAPQRKRAESDNQRGKTAKDKNYVFTQIMKIEKINKETEKKIQVKKEEIKNNDIVQIIEDTKKQIKDEEKKLEIIEQEQKYQEQLYIQELMQQQIQLQNNKSLMSGNSTSQNQSLQKANFINQIINEQSFINEPIMENQALIDRQVSAESDVRTQLFSREAQFLLQKQETDIAVRSDEQSEGISPIAVANQVQAERRQILSSQQQVKRSRSRGKESQGRSSINRKELNKSYEFGIIFKPDTEYYTDSELMNNTSAGLRISHARKKSLKNLQDRKLDNSNQLFKAFITTKKLEFLRPGLDPIQEDEGQVNNNYNFSPRRFNRYPRFTIFMKPNENIGENRYVMQNTVSLNPQFLSYLMENQQHVQIKAVKDLPNNQLIVQQAQDQGIIINNKKLGSTQVIDPFEKVILIKGIDNSILTSFRTLKKQNNLISDTLKVIHNKFQPFKGRSSYFKMSEKGLIDKMPYPLTDNEEAIDAVNTRILENNYRLSQEVAVGQTGGSRENTLFDESKLPPHQLINAYPENSQEPLGQDLAHLNQNFNQYLFPSTSSRDRIQVYEDLTNHYQIPTQRNINTANLESQMKSQRSQGQIKRDKSEEQKVNTNIMRRNKFQYPKNMSINNQQFQQNENVRNEYFSSKKPTFQHESRLMTANQDSYVESQDDHTLSDIIQGQKYSSKVINQFTIPNQQISQEQASLMMAANSPNNGSLGQNTTFQIPNSEPPQKISIHAKFKRNLNEDLNNSVLQSQQDLQKNADNLGRNTASPSKSPTNRERKEIIILSKIDPSSQAFPNQNYDSANQGYQNPNQLPSRQLSTAKSHQKNPFRSLPNRRQIKPYQNPKLEYQQQQDEMNGITESAVKLEILNLADRNSQTAKQTTRRQSTKYDNFSRSTKNKYAKQNELSKSINQNMFKQHQVLPPLLQNQQSSLQYAQTISALNKPGSNITTLKNNFNQLPLNNTSKIKQVIDDLYSKEKRYIKQYVRDDLLQIQNPIFNLNKYQNLQTYTNLTTKSDLRINSAGSYQQQYGFNQHNLGIGSPFNIGSGLSQGINFKDEGADIISLNQERIKQQVMIPNQYDYFMKSDLTGSLAMTSTFKNTAIMNEMQMTGVKR